MNIHSVNLTKMYFKGSAHEVVALDSANVEIREKDFCLLTGPSGSGKTTLLSMLGLLTRQTRGKVFYDDQEVSSYSDAWQTKIRKNKVGFIFQQYNLLPQFSAWENVALPTLCSNTTASERKKQATQVMTKLGLKHRIDFKVASLSGGEQQRVAIARALITNPEVIFADEPTAAVDDQTAISILELFKELKNDGKTIIIATHDKSLLKEGTLHLDVNNGVVQQSRNETF